MEDGKIKIVKNWSELKSVRDIQIFLDFANFYKRFIRNFNKIAASLTIILRTTNKTSRDKTQSSQANNSRKNWDRVSDVDSTGNDGSVDKDVEYLSIVKKLAKKAKFD